MMMVLPMEMMTSLTIQTSTPTQTMMERETMPIPMMMEMVFLMKKKLITDPIPKTLTQMVMVSMTGKKKKTVQTPTTPIRTVTVSMMGKKKTTEQTLMSLTPMGMGLKMVTMTTLLIPKTKIQTRMVYLTMKKTKMVLTRMIQIPMETEWRMGRMISPMIQTRTPTQTMMEKETIVILMTMGMVFLMKKK